MEGSLPAACSECDMMDSFSRDSTQMFFLTPTHLLYRSMDYDLTIVSNTLVSALVTRFQLSPTSANALNIVLLRLIAVARQHDIKAFKVPPVALKLLTTLSKNMKYFIILYALKHIFSYREYLRTLHREWSWQGLNQLDQDDADSPKAKLFVVDISNICRAIDSVHKFMEIHPDMFCTDISYRLVTIGDNPEPYRVYSEPLVFNDTIHGVDGYIETYFDVITDHKNNKLPNYTMKLHIRKKIASKMCYITQLETYAARQAKTGNIVNLVYYKVMSRNLIMSTFYDEPLVRWQSDVKYLNDSYFCEHRDFLFEIMRSKTDGTLSDGSGWNNLILHGAPGTGKSSFIYRIATTIKRSIISIDISLYLDKKRELYNLFYGQSFQLPGEEKRANVPPDCIIVLEEFDNAIRKLLELEKIHTLKQDMLTKSFKAKQDMLLAGDTQNDQEGDRPTKNKISLNQVSHEIGQAIHSNTIAIQNDTLRIFDLLELFQGVVSPPSRIIIATTNYYDEIKESLPSLFRPGRLSALEFKYLSWDLLNDLSIFYFGKPMSIQPRPITIATSQIVELALKYKITTDHDGFQHELVSLLG